MEVYINKLIAESEVNFENFIKTHKIDLTELIRYVLEHYGGSSSDLFFLKLFKKISKLTKMEWEEIF